MELQIIEKYIFSKDTIVNFVNVIVDLTQSTHSENEFWDKVDKELLIALIGACFNEFPSFERNMKSVLGMLEMYDGNKEVGVDLWFEELGERNPDHFAVKHYTNFKMASGKIRSSVIQSCVKRIKDFTCVIKG